MEGAELYFVNVAGVEKSDGSALVEPFLQFSRRNSWRGATPGIDSIDTKGDYFPLNLHQHSIERLVIALADFRAEIGETGNGPEIIEERVGSVGLG